MDPEKLVESYVSACNRQDIDGLLEIMHEGFAHYDAFWMETCVGRDAVQYFRDSFDKDQYLLQRVGKVIVIDDCVSFRYNAHAPTDPEFVRALFNGAVVFNVHDDKLMTVSDFYCDTDQYSLQEVTKLVARRHGLPKYAASGLSAYKASLYRKQLSTLMQDEKVYLDPELTLSQLASQIGCSMDHMSQLINTEFGTDFHILMKERRLRLARDLLLEESDDPNYAYRVAARAGFQSFEDFADSFKEMFGMTPTMFSSQMTRNIDPTK